MENINFNKKYGQNFLRDTNLLSAIVKDAGVGENDEVLEIGAGAGALTEKICEKAKKVVSYEIDKNLETLLKDKFKDKKNLSLIFADALKIPIEKIEENFTGTYKIVANIPYYITSPLIFKFLENSSRVESLTLMVQEEVGQKIIAVKGDKNYGAMTVMAQTYATAKICRKVNKKMFTPVPKVDSCIIKLVRKQNVQFDENFKRFVFNCFSMRRKMMINPLVKLGNYQKAKVEEVFNKLNIDLKIRAEEISPDMFRHIFEQLNQN